MATAVGDYGAICLSSGRESLEGETSSLSHLTKGILLQDKGLYQRSIREFSKGYAISFAHRNYSLASDFSLKLAEIHKIQGNLAESRKWSIKAYDLYQGRPDPTAFRVEQNEYAISSVNPLGTDGVGECIALVLYHPETNTIGLAHIDKLTSPESIQTLIQQMPKGPIEVSIIGGSQKSPELLAISKENLRKIHEALSTREAITIKQQLTMDVAHPTAIVVTPDGQIHHACPAYPSQNRFIRDGLAALSDHQRPLTCAYEDVDTKALLVISPDVQRNIKSYLALSEKEITDLYPSSSPKTAILIEDISALLKAEASIIERLAEQTFGSINPSSLAKTRALVEGQNLLYRGDD